MHAYSARWNVLLDSIFGWFLFLGIAQVLGVVAVARRIAQRAVRSSYEVVVAVALVLLGQGYLALDWDRRLRDVLVLKLVPV